MGRPVLGPKQEPKGHVLDLHDVEAIAGALIAGAKQDIEHEARAGVTCKWNGVTVKHCERGGHICPGCRMLIWDCGRAFLARLADALQDVPAGELLNVLEAADHAQAG